MTIRKPFPAYALHLDYYDGNIFPREEKARAAGAFMFLLEEAPRPQIYSVSGNEAHIRIDDELDPEYYAEIIGSIAIAEQSPEIAKIVFDINSPGGTVDGVFQAAEVIATAKKPTEARVSYLCASAAYWLASQCNSITATAETAMIGSIGVVVVVYDDKKALEEWGYKRYYVTSSKSPKKVADVSTEEGRAQIVERLDDTYEVFSKAVAEGRGVSTDEVDEKYGQGAVMIARKALAAGMIDDIQNISTVREEPKMEQFTREQLDAAVTAALGKQKALFMAHIGWVVKGAKLETVLENIKAEKTLDECASAYMDEALAAKELAKQTADLPPVILPKDDKVKTEDQTKKEATAAQVAENLKAKGYDLDTNIK